MQIFTSNFVVPVTGHPIRNGALALEGSQIIDVGKFSELCLRYPAANVRDFGESAITPGFVNSHAHLELTAFRGMVDQFDHDFCKWLLEITKLRKSFEDDESKNVSALLGAAEAAAAGVTTVGDIGRIGVAGATALETLGMRGIVYQETEFSPDDSTADVDFGKLTSKFEKMNSNASKNVSIGLSPHAPYTVSRNLFEKIIRYSVEYKVPISIHAAESAAESDLMRNGKGIFSEVFFGGPHKWKIPYKSTIDYFADIGVLNAAPLLVHCIEVTETEIELIAKSGSKIAHCPKSNAKFGHGVAPLVKFLESGIPVGLGSDSMASNNTCDMLEETRTAGLISRISHKTKPFLSSRELFSLATIGGAKALGLEKQTGSLEAGKQADITVISLNGVGQKPITDVYSALVFSTAASSVTLTMVAGKIVYENGVLKGLDLKNLKSNSARLFEIDNPPV